MLYGFKDVLPRLLVSDVENWLCIPSYLELPYSPSPIVLPALLKLALNPGIIG